MKHIRSFLTAILVGLILSGPALAETQALARDPRVASALEFLGVWLEAQRAYGQIPGVSAAVVHDQELIWSGGFGYADLARKTPAVPGTIYSICSISKLFTSIAVMQLRDAGKLRLDDPVGKHLPWFTIRKTAPEGPEITIEGLLTHASGLPRESDYPYWTGPDFPFPTHDEIVARISKQQTLYPAETYFQYSNLGLTLAGEVVAAASGMPYDEYVRRNILDPLGLDSTTPEMPENQRGARLATGYGCMTRNGDRPLMPFFQTHGIAPAAGFASTAEDLARFAEWQFRLLDTGRTEVLKANTLREMYRVHWVDPDFETVWGLGFSVMKGDANSFVGHGGSCPGYRTGILLKPDERISTVFMSNALGVDSEGFARRIYDIVAPAIKAAVKDPAGTKPVDPELKKYTGSYSGAWGEIAMIVWEGGLAAVDLPTWDPVKDLTKLKKTGENTFRRVRKDDVLGEEIVFEMGPDGRPARMKWHSNYYPRVR
jgi:CubicO group peptidase (beta-lactamase class C family)